MTRPEALTDPNQALRAWAHMAYTSNSGVSSTGLALDANARCILDGARHVCVLTLPNALELFSEHAYPEPGFRLLLLDHDHTEQVADAPSGTKTF